MVTYTVEISVFGPCGIESRATVNVEEKPEAIELLARLELAPADHGPCWGAPAKSGPSGDVVIQPL